jgi:uncharacterized protein YegL
MPLLTESYKIDGAGTFTFSGVRPDQLRNTSYSLVSLALDISGSVSIYRDGLIKAVKTIAEACNKDPMVESLLFRVVEFNNNMKEIHPFKPLADIVVDDYDNHIECRGMTSLYDTVLNVVGATNTYATSLHQLDMEINGVIFIVTDGMDNASSYGPTDIKREIQKAIHGEHISSLTTILVGVNLDPSSAQALEDFKNRAGIDKFENIGDATPQNLAKFAGWVSKSVSSVSSSLQNGQIPVVSNLTF